MHLFNRMKIKKSLKKHFERGRKASCLLNYMNENPRVLELLLQGVQVV